MTKETARSVLIISVVAMVVSTLMREWFSAQGVSIGLWGIDGADLEIYLFGYLATAAALVGAMLALVCAFKGDNGPVAAARTALTIAAVAMVLFVVRLWVMDGMTGLSPGFALFVGPTAAIAARQLVGTLQTRP